MNQIRFKLRFDGICLLESVVHHILRKEFNGVKDCMIGFALDVSCALESELKSGERLEWDVLTKIEASEACFSLLIAIVEKGGRIAAAPHSVYGLGGKLFASDRYGQRSTVELVPYEAVYKKLVATVAKRLLDERDAEVC